MCRPRRLLTISTLTALLLIFAACENDQPDPANAPVDDAATAESGDAQADSAPADEVLADDPAEAVDPVAREQFVSILALPDPFERARRLGELLPAWGPEQVPTAQSLLVDYSIDLDAIAFELLVDFWAEHEPRAATGWAVTKAARLHRMSAVLAAFTKWAERDPEAAAAALGPLSVRYQELGDILRAGLVWGWYVSGDLDGLEAYVMSHGPGIGRQQIVSRYVRVRLQNEDRAVVMAWAEDYPETDPDLKRSIYRLMASNLAIYDDGMTEVWCERHCDGPYGAELRGIIARRWMRTRGADGLEWLAADYEEPGEDEDLDFALRLAFARWVRIDRDAVMRWGAALTPETAPAWMTPMVPVYARELAVDSPTEAIRWAESMTDAGGREEAMIDIARIWLGNDPTTAEVWLESSPLSEEQRVKARAPKPQLPTG